MVLIAVADKLTGLRLNFRTYILILCGFYLSLVFMLHFNLNREKVVISQARLVHKKHVIESILENNQKTNGRKLIVDLDADQSHDPGRQIQQMKKNQHDDKLQGEKKQGADESYMDKNILQEKQNKKTLNASISGENCWGDTYSSVNTLQEPVENVFVYSAYWDNRANDFDNQEKGIYIRVMAVIKFRYTPHLYCVFQSGKAIHSSPLTYYEMCENHMRPYGGYILSCKVPKEVKQRACSVMVSDKPAIGKENLRTKVYPTVQNSDKRKFSICVPPVFGSLDRNKVVEFVELSQILGAEHITIYDYDANEKLLKLLKYYEDKGIVTVLPWHLPDKITENSIWYKGQLVTIQDCLYRHMPVSEYVSFNDVDEFLTPHKHTYWNEMMTDLSTPQHCAFQFKMAFFDPEKAESYNGDSRYKKLITVTNTQRTSVLSRVRTKCMVKPTLIFEKGIHHVSKPIYADLKTEQVDPSEGFLHHYRVCLGDFGMSCHQYEEDKKLSMFAKTLHNKVQATLEDLNL